MGLFDFVYFLLTPLLFLVAFFLLKNRLRKHKCVSCSFIFCPDQKFSKLNLQTVPNWPCLMLSSSPYEQSQCAALKKSFLLLSQLSVNP